MILKDVEPFEAYDCKTSGCGYEGESFDAYVNGIQHVLEDLDSAPEIDPESLLVVKQLRAEMKRLKKSREMWRDRTRKLLANAMETSADLEKVKAERDAAAKILRDLAFKSKPCFLCKRWGKKCSDSFHLCDKRNGYWEFCGVKED